MVTLQILVLPFLVRIRVPQPLKREVSTHGSLFLFCINRQRKPLYIHKPHCHRCHRHRCHRWREPLVHTRQPRFMVSSSLGMVAEAWLVVIFHIALLLACVAVWRGTGACVCRAQAGDGEGSASVLGSENFFSGERKNFPWAGSKIFPFERGKIPHSRRGASCLKRVAHWGQQLWRRLGQMGMVCSCL